METDAGRNIKIKVCMVHPMKTPKSRNEVKHGMLKVDDKIETDHADHNIHPVRQ